MAIKIVKSNEKVAAKAIENFEATIGKTLPNDYKTFLLTFNGGEPEDNEFSVPKAKTGSNVRVFYGLTDKHGEGDLFHEHEVLIERVPAGILPIGGDSCGNCICLSLRSDTFGQVFFWDHELEADEGKPATFSNLFLVGDSFDNFLARLKKFDASQVRLKPGQVKKVWGNPNFKPEF
jgi:cell wall assembly regulator SMI1